MPEGRFTVENAWPIPDARGASRGVVAEGPVFSHALGALRLFRYEVRCWREGIIYDADWSVGGPKPVSSDLGAGRRVLDLLPAMPTHVWGRRIPMTGDMWNSNSTISWALTRAGLDARSIPPPLGGRVPGWHAGIAVARQEMDGATTVAGTRLG